MALYFFDTNDGDVVARDADGLDIPDEARIRAEAIAALADMARDRLPDGDAHVFSVKVRDASGRHIFHATLTLVAEWLLDPPPVDGKRHRWQPRRS